MNTQTLTISGKDFVLLPKRQFDQMQARLDAIDAEEQGDIAESRRRATEPSFSLAQVRKKLGR